MISTMTAGVLCIVWWYAGSIFAVNFAKYTRKSTRSKITALIYMLAALALTAYAFAVAE
jgi:hypothetical protein